MQKRLANNPLISGSLVYLISNLLNAGIQLALLPVLTRYLSPDRYGEVAMFQTPIGALTAVIGLSVAGAARRKFYDSEHGNSDLRQFMDSCLQILMFTTSFTLLMLVAFHAWVSDWLDLDSTWIFAAVIATTAIIIMQLRLVQWQVRSKSKSYGVFQVSQSLFNLLLSLFLVIILLRGAEGRMLAVVLSFVLFAVLAIWSLRRDDLIDIFRWRPDFY